MKVSEWFCAIILVLMLVIGFAGFFIGEKKNSQSISILEFIGGNNGQKEQR